MPLPPPAASIPQGQRAAYALFLRPWDRHERAWRASVWYSLGACAAFLLYSLRMVVHPVEMQWGMAWNVFLALVPLPMAWGVAVGAASRSAWVRRLSVLPFLGWLLFVPNSFYLVTDLVHLRQRQWFWVDLPAYAMMAWCCIQCALLSYAVMARHLRRVCGWGYPLLATILIGLVMMGIHAGRFARFNSWDMLTDLGRVMGEVPREYAMASANTLIYGYGTFAILILICYLPMRHYEQPDDPPA